MYQMTRVRSIAQIRQQTQMQKNIIFDTPPADLTLQNFLKRSARTYAGETGNPIIEPWNNQSEQEQIPLSSTNLQHLKLFRKTRLKEKPMQSGDTASKQLSPRKTVFQSPKQHSSQSIQRQAIINQGQNQIWQSCPNFQANLVKGNKPIPIAEDFLRSSWKSNRWHGKLLNSQKAINEQDLSRSQSRSLSPKRLNLGKQINADSHKSYHNLERKLIQQVSYGSQLKKFSSKLNRFLNSKKTHQLAKQMMGSPITQKDKNCEIRESRKNAYNEPEQVILHRLISGKSMDQNSTQKDVRASTGFRNKTQNYFKNQMLFSDGNDMERKNCDSSPERVKSKTHHTKNQKHKKLYVMHKYSFLKQESAISKKTRSNAFPPNAIPNQPQNSTENPIDIKKRSLRTSASDMVFKLLQQYSYQQFRNGTSGSFSANKQNKTFYQEKNIIQPNRQSRQSILDSKSLDEHFQGLFAVGVGRIKTETEVTHSQSFKGKAIVDIPSKQTQTNKFSMQQTRNHKETGLKALRKNKIEIQSGSPRKIRPKLFTNQQIFDHEASFSIMGYQNISSEE